jgi:hypothetical protein
MLYAIFLGLFAGVPVRRNAQEPKSGVFCNPAPVTLIESKRFTKIAPNPCRMKAFHDTPGGWGRIKHEPPKRIFTSNIV